MYSEIEKNPIKFLNNSSQKEIEKFITTCSDFYYNSETGETLVSDQTFDFIKDFLEKKYPSSKVLNQIGSNIKKDKVKLPFHMGSMNKKKTEKEIDKWIKDYPGEVVISDKLDGISFLLSPKLFFISLKFLEASISCIFPFLSPFLLLFSIHI